jgi:hypothetical protein
MRTTQGQVASGRNVQTIITSLKNTTSLNMYRWTRLSNARPTHLLSGSNTSRFFCDLFNFHDIPAKLSRNAKQPGKTRRIRLIS